MAAQSSNSTIDGMNCKDLLSFDPEDDFRDILHDLLDENNNNLNFLSEIKVETQLDTIFICEGTIHKNGRDFGNSVQIEFQQDTFECNCNAQQTQISDAIFVCYLCKFDHRFENMKVLKQHMNEIHTTNNNQFKNNVSEKPASKICEKNFGDKNTLRNHPLVHSNEKPFACTICYKAFRLKGNLKTHLLIHSNEKPFACTICDKKFRRRHTLKNHLLIHSNEKPFACTICDKAFRHKQNLKRHLLNHKSLIATTK